MSARSRWVTPSEIGAWSYCAHAWSRTYLAGVRPDAQARGRLHAGDQHHQRHDRQVRSANGLLQLARWILLAALLGAAWLLLAGAAPATLTPTADPRWEWIVGGIAAAGLAALLLRSAARAVARPTGLPADAGQGGAAELPLADPARRLRGRIDRRVEVTEDGHTRSAAVEIKPTRRTPRGGRPYTSDRLQAGAGGLLLQATDPAHAARHALLVYADRTHSIPLNPDLVHAIDHAITAIRAARHHGTADRNHDQPARCRGCSVRTGCTQRLA